MILLIKFMWLGICSPIVLSLSCCLEQCKLIVTRFVSGGSDSMSSIVHASGPAPWPARNLSMIGCLISSCCFLLLRLTSSSWSVNATLCPGVVWNIFSVRSDCCGWSPKCQCAIEPRPASFCFGPKCHKKTEQ